MTLRGDMAQELGLLKAKLVQGEIPWLKMASVLRGAAHACRSVDVPTIWREVSMRGRSERVDEFGYDPELAHRWAPILDFLYHSYFRTEATGLGHLPENGRALLVANHSGGIPYDAVMLACALKFDHAAQRTLRPLLEDFVFHFPYLGVLLNRLGGVRACQENAERLLDRGDVVAVFPEGVKGISKLYRERYQLQRFGRGGFVKLALRTGTPIFPTAIIGAEEVHPKLGRLTWLAHNIGVPYFPITPTFPWLGPLGLVPLPTKWKIAVAGPVDLSGYSAEAANDRALVAKLAEEIRQIVQAMVDDLLATRNSVLFG